MTGRFIKDMDQMREEQERTFQSIRDGKCGCIRCIEGRGEFAIHMVVCPNCGNKRCPKATLHSLECTGSNEPGQAGSVYA